MARRWRLAVAVVVLVVGSATGARADPSVPRRVVVTLRDGGGVVQGELVEAIPNDHTTVRLATGEVKRFEASQIAETDGAEGTPAPHTVPVPLAPSSLLQITATTVNINLGRAPESDPAVVPSPRAGSFSPDVPSTGPRSQPPRVIQVDDGSARSGLNAGALISLGIGAALTVPAVYLLARPAPDRARGENADDDRTTGWVLLANGAPWILTGVIILAVSESSPRSAFTDVKGAPRVALGRAASLGFDGLQF